MITLPWLFDNIPSRYLGFFFFSLLYSLSEALFEISFPREFNPRCLKNLWAWIAYGVPPSSLKQRTRIYTDKPQCWELEMCIWYEYLLSQNSCYNRIWRDNVQLLKTLPQLARNNIRPIPKTHRRKQVFKIQFSGISIHCRYNLINRTKLWDSPCCSHRFQSLPSLFGFSFRWNVRNLVHLSNL